MLDMISPTRLNDHISLVEVQVLVDSISLTLLKQTRRASSIRQQAHRTSSSGISKNDRHHCVLINQPQSTNTIYPQSYSHIPLIVGQTRTILS